MVSFSDQQFHLSISSLLERPLQVVRPPIKDSPRVAKACTSFLIIWKLGVVVLMYNQLDIIVLSTKFSQPQNE
eukprot:snap_masked-scaffold_1-processed-gene-10.9-mRNA-1 protein AED:1.00 eAED:1.00 QI:0/-1/0/0/-1/1/1/0/72